MSEPNLTKYKKSADFNSILVENMEILSTMDNYYHWISSWIREYTGNRILEIGCGSGNLTSSFLDKSFVMGMDYSEQYINIFNKRFISNKNIHSIHADIFNPDSVHDLKKYDIDTLISMNTFEHIKNDQQAFDNAYEILEYGGVFILVVPAMKFLYSILDYEGGHYRRYTNKDIKIKLSKSGFKIDKIFYMNFAGAIGWYLNYVFLKRRIFSSSTFDIYNSLVPLFKLVEGYIKPPIGLSIFCVAKKL